MPRQNDVFLIGIVSAPPSLKIKNGEIIQAAIPLHTIFGRRSYKDSLFTGDTEGEDIAGKGFTVIWVYTKEKSMIRKIRQCRMFDAVELKGCVRVMATKKKAICPKCGHPVIYTGFVFLSKAPRSHLPGRSLFPAHFQSETGENPDTTIVKCLGSASM